MSSSSVTDIERGLVARYLARVLARTDLPVRVARQIVFWLNERSEAYSIAIPAPILECLGALYGTGFKLTEFERALIENRAELVATLDKVASATSRPEPLATNAEMLTRALGLPAAAWKIVGLVAVYTRFEQVCYLANTVSETAAPVSRAVALMTGEPVRVVEELLSPAGDLVASGLIQLRDGDQIAGGAGRLAIPSRVNAALDRTFAGFEEMRNALLGEPLLSPMERGDYDHVKDDRDLLIGVLEGAVREAPAGLNILLYGPPGSGKTELAKVAAAAAGLSLFAAGEESEAQESDRSGRLADLVFSGRLLAGQTRTALLFDEMEDVAVHLIRRGGSKVFLNRLLETNPVPIVWTSNDLGSIDPALLRRMTLAIELKRPPAVQRQRILAQQVKRLGLTLTDAEIETLARRVDATPAILGNALRAAKLSGGGAAAVERAALGIVRAVSGIVARQPGAIPEFDPFLATADVDLVGLTDRLVAGGARAFSICLSGPPGTGKSAFARYLARRLGLEILQKRASDILGPYVGQTERSIADAFAEAREANALLVFDEADSLLLDRRDAVRSWEVSQVNEMLTWMEDHPLPVCFTTNLMDRIDQASLRRFTFSARFEFLPRAGLERAWRVFLETSRPPAAGLEHQNLTPGDFAKARKQAEMLGILTDPDRLAELLGEIGRSKPGAGGTLGFVR